MSTMTGSFRVADARSSALVLRKTTVRATGCAHRVTTACRPGARESLRAARLAALAIKPLRPGLQAAAKVAKALKRPAETTRTAAEELAEERLNTITHGLGLAVSAAAVAFLFVEAVMTGGWLRMASCGVYGVSLLMMYAASTSLHAARKPNLKRRCQLFDHVAIYLLIAGTYTPFLGALMRGYVGFGLLACVWALAAVGIAIKLKHADHLGDTSPLPCLGLGWLVLAAIKPLLAVLPLGGMVLLVAGGVSYSIGMIFYCRDDKRYFHAIWHLLVMAGTGFHFAAILLYVAA